MSHSGPRIHSDLKQEDFKLNCQTQHEVGVLAVHIGLVLETRHHGFVARLSSSPTRDLVLTIGSWIFLINLAEQPPYHHHHSCLPDLSWDPFWKEEG